MHGAQDEAKPRLGIGYNSLALPIAAGIFAPLGLTLRPEIGAIAMSGSSVLVAHNALALKRLHLPRSAGTSEVNGRPEDEPEPSDREYDQRFRPGAESASQAVAAETRERRSR